MQNEKKRKKQMKAKSESGTRGDGKVAPADASNSKPEGGSTFGDDDDGEIEEEEENEEENEEEEEEGIYNAEALHDKLEDIAWTQEQPWAETLAITSEKPIDIKDVDDDLERELAFYNQALDAARQAIHRFERAGVAWQRPPDYFAEMVKSDEHMARVKEQLLYEQKVIEEAEQRRKEREAKKYAKQVAAEKRKERAQEKKRAIEGVSSLRKQREKEGFAGDLDIDIELEKVNNGQKRNPKGELGERFAGNRSKSAKRAFKDGKYGFGGPKRLRKQNDAYSAAGGDYRRSSFDDGFAGKKGGKATKGKKQQNRPGKARRQAMKQRKGAH